MENSVSIKGTKSGIILVLNEKETFSSLKRELAEKFKASASFFGESVRGIIFRGKKLTEKQQQELIEIIHQNSKLKIACVIDEDEKLEATIRKNLDAELEKNPPSPKPSEPSDKELMGLEPGNGLFHKGSLRSGQVLDVDSSIVILGDINPGAKVVSQGNVIVLGSLRGNVFAGSTGNTDAFVVALDMDPTQIRIADTIARAPDKQDYRWKRKKESETKIAFYEDGNIYIEPLGKDVLADIRL